MSPARWFLCLTLTLWSCGELPDPSDDAGLSDAGLPDAGEPRCTRGAEGPCPAGRVCAGGACIVDLDPGVPVNALESLATFNEVWRFIDESYAAFAAGSVDWAEVKARYSARIEAAETDYALSWEIAQALAEVGDGHVGLSRQAFCNLNPGFGFNLSNTGGCVTEVSGRLLVYKTQPGHPTGLQPGDELLKLDGRSVEEALFDLERQPRCYVSASTPASARARRVHSLLFRAAEDSTLTVRGVDGVERTLNIVRQGSLACDGRPVLDDVEAHGYGITSKLLDGDVRYIYLPQFGGFDSSGNLVSEPVITVLRALFEDAVNRSGVVLDLRNNGGGYPQVYMALASWLFPSPTVLFRCRQKNGPGHADLGALWNQTSSPDAQLQYTGKLAVLVNAQSVSAADFTPGFLYEHGRAATFGVPTSGAFGSAAPATPVGDWSLSYSDIECQNLAGTLLEGNPPPVTFPLDFDAGALAQGADSVLEAARTWVLQP